MTSMSLSIIKQRIYKIHKHIGHVATNRYAYEETCTVKPLISTQGLIVNFEILDGPLIEGGLIRGRGFIENKFFTWGLNP